MKYAGKEICEHKRIKESIKMYLGIDLGGTNIAVGLVDDECNVVKKASAPTGRKRPFEEIVADMAKLCKEVLEETGTSIDSVKAIGLGSPGIPDTVNKKIVYASSMPTFKNAPIQTELWKYFPNIPVYVENDANAAAYGEVLAGAAKDYSNVVVVTIGTGVGGGVVIDNKIYAGFNHAGSEIGHKVIVMGGIDCECGRSGCWEVYASASALIRQTKEAAAEHPESIIHKLTEGNLENVNGKTAFDAMRKGDETGKAVVEKYIEYLGTGIVDIINVFQPEAIVIGGGVSKEGDNLIHPLTEYMEKYSYGVDVEKTKLMTAKLGNDAGIVGAAMLWKQA